MYERGFRTWSQLHGRAMSDSELHWECLRHLDTAFPRHPSFPPGLTVHDPVPGVLIAKGTSTWAAALPPCDLAPLEHELMLQVAARCPATAIISGADETTLPFPEWFGEDSHHIAVLFLAWAYILSARWAELLPDASHPEYSDCAADSMHESGDRGLVEVDIGDVDEEAARWWTAVLAPGSGWAARIQVNNGPSMYSPWCLNIQCKHQFSLPRRPKPQQPPYGSRAPSYTAARRYLASYCVLHGVTEQSRAALSAALLIPVAAYDGRKIQLPVAPFRPKEAVEQYTNGKMDPAVSDAQLDRLLTMSCNARGVKALLNSVFFEPDVPCNLCTAWVQGTFALLDTDDVKEPHRLARVLMKRDAGLGFLWVGAFIIGVHESCFKEVVSGRWKVDLHAAAWTGTRVSFIQDPLPSQPPERDEISRADECRLQYLTRSNDPPPLAFAPFGSTALIDTDLQVRYHVRCNAVHGLEYCGFAWDCGEGKWEAQNDTGQTPLRAKDGVATGGDASAIVYDGLDRHDEACSKAATQGVFAWLREEDGFPAAERAIRQHTWVYSGDHCDYGPCSDSPARSSAGGELHGWLGRTMTVRSNSM